LNSNKENIKINYNLESLRGFAALFVVFGHVIEHHTSFDANYHIKYFNILFRDSEVAHISVLIFFVLSGYVIGITNKDKLKKETVFIYLKKRFIRLYPIYFVSVIFTLIISIHYALPIILATFTITQGLVSKVIWENNPLWSLNYEVLYYILFIGISFFNIKISKVIASSLLIAVISHYVFPSFSILSSYFFGFLFWVTGLFIAKYLNKRATPVNYNFLVGILFYIISISALINHFGLYTNVMSAISKVFSYPATTNWATTMIGFQDLILIPYCFCIVIVFADIDFKFKVKLFWLLQILPLLGIYHILRLEHDNKSLMYTVIDYLIAMILFIFGTHISQKVSSLIIKFGTWIGGISYGIYVIHFPVLCTFGRFVFLSGSPILFLVKVFLFLCITITIAFFLEKKYQKWMKSIFSRN
jgi:peptidoglycan/LPS O-acetylase OafA/YrhL